MEETDRIKQHYQERKKDPTVSKNSSYSIYNNEVVNERQKLYKQIIASKFKNISDVQLMEMGAGSGANLHFFNELGIKHQNIYANELLQDRVEELKLNFPNIHTFPGDALQLTFENKFHITFQSTVFTSILDFDFKKKLADKLWTMTQPNGIVLWYDFIYNNPKNKSVKGIAKDEIKELFKHSKKIEFYKVTLAPPIGRRFQKFYSLLNGFSFLRTHTIAVIHK